MTSKKPIERFEDMNRTSRRYRWGDRHFRFNHFRELATGYPSFTAPVQDKRALSREIADQTAAFLASGGEINTIPQGVSGLPQVDPVGRLFLERDIDWPDEGRFKVRFHRGIN